MTAPSFPRLFSPLTIGSVMLPVLMATDDDCIPGFAVLTGIALNIPFARRSGRDERLTRLRTAPSPPHRVGNENLIFPNRPDSRACKL